MKIKPIKNSRDHADAIKRIEVLWGAKKNTSEEAELDVLVTLVESYEMEHHKIDAPDPVQAIIFRMEQMGMSRSQLATIVGSRSHLSEVLSGKRPLSLSMITKLRSELGMSADVLIPSRAA